MNMKTIARMAGVSVATVSKIINNYPDIGDETRKRVMKIMEETGYRPYSLVKPADNKQTTLVGVVFAGKINVDFSHPFFIDVINAFKKQIGLLGYDLLLFSNEKFTNDGEDYLQRCRHFEVDGCIIINGDEIEPSVWDLDQSDVPCIGVDIKLTGKNSAFVMSNNEQISFKVVEHFYLSGYREVGLISIERKSGIIETREESFKQALKRFAIPVESKWFVASEGYAEEDGYQAMKRMIDSGPLPKAVFAVTDLLAFGAIRALKEHGFNIPHDVAIIGCDDIDACNYISPPLTTVKQDKQKIGRLAAMMLYDLMNKQIVGNSIMVEPELVIRRSCGYDMTGGEVGR